MGDTGAALSVRIAGLSRQQNDPLPLWRRLLPSPTSLLLVVLFIFTLILNGDIKPMIKRGFFCDDSSINYPFKIDTVGMKSLLFVSFFVPAIVIKICDNALNRLLQQLPVQSRLEAEFSKKDRRVRRKVSDTNEDSGSDDDDDDDVEADNLLPSVNKIKRRHLIVNEDGADYEALTTSDKEELRGHVGSGGAAGSVGSAVANGPVEGEPAEVENEFTRVPLENGQIRRRYSLLMISAKLLQQAFGECQLFCFGFISTMFFTGIGKVTCGRLRPHFLQRCQPDVDCALAANANKYIDEFTCTNDKLRSRDMSYITTSWPSGHAAVSFFSMLYLIIYLNSVIPILVHLGSQKVKRRFDPLILYAIYVLMVCLAGFISLTRVIDYHHHPLDVLSGSVIGSLVAIGLPKSTLMNQLKSNVIS